MIPVLANCGENALEILSKDACFDLVLTDMHMPGMDGVELATSIKQVYPNLSIILLSSAGNETCKNYPHLFSSIITGITCCVTLFCVLNFIQQKS